MSPSPSPASSFTPGNPSLCPPALLGVCKLLTLPAGEGSTLARGAGEGSRLDRGAGEGNKGACPADMGRGESCRGSSIKLNELVLLGEGMGDSAGFCDTWAEMPNVSRSSDGRA